MGHYQSVTIYRKVPLRLLIVFVVVNNSGINMNRIMRRVYCREGDIKGIMKIILYGAGQFGKNMYNILKHMHLDDQVMGFCDKRANELAGIADKEVYSYKQAKKMNIPFVISVSKESLISEVRELLDRDQVSYFASIHEWAQHNGVDMVTWNRELCAFYHIQGMDHYFNEAENELALSIFWKEDSPFYQMFQQLNLNNVIELACGRGRHVQQYVEQASHITLVDILDKNIEFCKERFLYESKISYYCNDGYNLKTLEDNQYSSLFTYDAMVHFELLDIYSYLKDIWRVLMPGGYALFHHSNNTMDYKLSYERAKENGRNYMSKDLFAYLAYRCGFEIVEQKVIDWGGIPQLDCISLIRKGNCYGMQDFKEN